MYQPTHIYRNALSLWLAVLILMLTACLDEDLEEQKGTAAVQVGDAVPAFVLTDDSGHELSSASLAGQAYVLSFFDTRCPDCWQELQVLQRLYDSFHAQVKVLNVPRSQDQETVRAYWEKERLTMPFYMPEDKDLYYQFAQKTVPRTYVIDRGGRICASFTDAPVADYDTLCSLLQQLSGLTAGQDGMVDLSVRLRVAANSGADSDYLHNEYVVSRLDLWFFDAETKQFFTKTSVYNITTDETTSDFEYDITYIVQSVRLKVGYYDIFAIANYYDSPDEAENEMDFLNMVDSITYKDGIEANIPDRGPVMTSRTTALLGVDLVPWSNQHYYLTIELERVMAKLQIGVSHSIFHLEHNGEKYADVNITNYKFVNLINHYYLFPHKADLQALGEQPEFVMPDNFDAYSDQGDQYMIDPLFFKKTASVVDAAAMRHGYLSWYGDYTNGNFASMPAAEKYVYVYLLENTAFKNSQKNGYSPGIIFKAAVNPSFVYLYDSQQHTLVKETRPEYWPKTLYLYNYTFYGSIQCINIVSGLTLDELENYTDAQLSPYGIKPCKFNQGVYETYYAYWIQHRGSQDDRMGPMEYGIVRNHFYKIVVTAVSGLGNSAITPDIMRDNYPNSYVDVEGM